MEALTGATGSGEAQSENGENHEGVCSTFLQTFANIVPCLFVKRRLNY